VILFYFYFVFAVNMAVSLIFFFLLGVVHSAEWFIVQINKYKKINFTKN